MLITLKNLSLLFHQEWKLQKRICIAIESGDANAQVEANKRIAQLHLRMQNLAAERRQRRTKTMQAEKPVQLSDGPTEMPSLQHQILKLKNGLKGILGLVKIEL